MQKYWVLSCLALLLSLPVSGHVGSHTRIQKIGMEIEAMASAPIGERSGLLARLYQLRGEEFLVTGNWDRAEADFRRALQLQPSGTRVLLPLARMFHGRGDEGRALDEISRYLRRHADDEQALLLRSRILQALGRYREALPDLESVLDLQSRPDVALVLERADLQARLGQWSAAVGGIRQAEEVLGRLLVLENKRIDLLRRQGDTEAALVVLDRLLTQVPRKERWLLIKAQLLEQAGRRSEARKQYRGVLDTLDRLPPRLSRVPAMKNLRKQARQALLGGIAPLSSADTAVQLTSGQ